MAQHRHHFYSYTKRSFGPRCLENFETKFRDSVEMFALLHISLVPNDFPWQKNHIVTITIVFIPLRLTTLVSFEED